MPEPRGLSEVLLKPRQDMRFEDVCLRSSPTVNSDAIVNASEKTMMMAEANLSADGDRSDEEADSSDEEADSGNLSEDDWGEMADEKDDSGTFQPAAPPPTGLLLPRTRQIEVKNKHGRLIGIITVDAEDYDKVKAGWLTGVKQPTKEQPNRFITRHNSVELGHVIIGKPPRKHVVDHINSNTSDFRKVNLRFATFGLNSHNREKASGTSSRYIGVTRVKAAKTTKKWKAACSFNKQVYYFGVFEVELEAAKSRDRGVLALYGAGAKVNGVLTEAEVSAAVAGPKPSPKSVKRSKKHPELQLPLGVSFDEKRKQYMAQWSVDGVPKLMRSGNREEAIQAREAGQALFERAKEEKDNQPLDRSVPITYNDEKQAIIWTNQTSGVQRPILVDEDLWHEFNQHSWSWPNSMEYPYGAVNNLPVVMHRWAWRKQNPDQEIPEDCSIDHWRQNLSDCRRAHLRVLSRSGQSQNRRKRKGLCTSDFVGVSRSGETRWESVLGGKFLGYFDTQIEAAAAYNERAKVLFPGGHLNEFDAAELETALTAKRLKATLPPRTQARNISGYSGVTWHHQNGGWVVKFKGKYIGTFQQKRQAVMAWNAQAAIHGKPQHIVPSDD